MKLLYNEIQLKLIYNINKVSRVSCSCRPPLSAGSYYSGSPPPRILNLPIILPGYCLCTSFG